MNEKFVRYMGKSMIFILCCNRKIPEIKTSTHQNRVKSTVFYYDNSMNSIFKWKTKKF